MTLLTLFGATRSGKNFQIILTKVDLVEAEDLARIHAKVKAQLEQRGYRKWLARIMMVSSTSCAGIPILKKELASLAYAGPRLMERPAQYLRIGEPQRPSLRLSGPSGGGLGRQNSAGFGLNSQLRQQRLSGSKPVLGARGRAPLRQTGRAGRPRR
jgi:hypothetical protein